LQSTEYDHISGHSAYFSRQKFFVISPNCYKPINRNPSNTLDETIQGIVAQQFILREHRIARQSPILVIFRITVDVLF